MESQNKEEEITIIPDEKITYGRKRKIVENDAEVIDKAEFEKHVQSQKRKKSAKLSSRIQQTRKMKAKEEEDDDDDDENDDEDVKKNQKNKKRKIEKEKDDEDVKIIKVEKNKRSAYQRVTAKELMKQVLVNLSDKHKQAIQKIGFGAFLNLDAPHYVDSWLTQQLLSNFDPKRCCLMLPGREEEILFDEIDVHMTYGLPMGDIAILDTIENKNECANFMQKWRKNFNLKVGAPTNAQLINRIQKVKEVDKEQKQVSDEFIWNFLVCVVNSCIRSTNNKQLYIKFLYSCKDTKNIVKLNWCKFVKEHLMETTKKWLDGESFFTGPLIFLMVSYFDRVQRKGLEIPRQVPLISLWNQERFHTRLKFEKDLGFGKGKVLERMKLNGLEKRQENDKGKKKEQPLTIREKQGEKKVIKKQGKDKGKEKVVENQSMTCDSITSPNDMMDFLSKFGDLAKSLASNVKEMYSMLEQAKDIFVEEETTGKMHHLIDNIWCKYTTKPLVNQEEEKQQTKSPSILSQDQHFFDEPAFIEELDMLMNIAWKKFNVEKSPKSLGHALPSNEGEREKNNNERNINEKIDDTISSPILEQEEKQKQRQKNNQEKRQEAKEGEKQEEQEGEIQIWG